VPVVGILHPNAAFRRTVRRGLRPFRLRAAVCRTADALGLLFRREVVDAVILGGTPGGPDRSAPLLERYPRVPLFVAGTFRPGDGAALARYRHAGVRGILVDGVDDAAAAELVAVRTASRRRRAALGDAPRLLRLTEPIQRRAWEEVLFRVDARPATADIARALRVTREHLSREFGAGGAPNLKRVIDLVRVVCAADLLGNPGYDVPTVARVLRYSSPGHLGACAERVAGVATDELGTLPAAEVLARFVRGRTRSRL
jgi:AraC-like DNA-binding protein